MMPEPQPPSQPPRHAFLPGNGGLIVLLMVAFSLLTAWAFAVPVYEAPDEPHHWHYAHYLHEHRQLPLYTRVLVEANSPPLYYLLVAPFAASTAEPALIINKKYESPLPPRYFDSTARDWGKYWAIRLPRLVSVVISVFTVLFCYLAGLEATGKRLTGLLVGGLAALLPQFTFRGMNVSNDALVTMACAASTYLSVRLIRRGFTWRSGVAAALVIAVAFLSKTNAIFLPAPVGLALLFAPGQPGDWRSRFARLSVLGIPLLLAAPWLIRNQLLYGDPLASRVMLSVVSNIVDAKPITSPYFYTIFPTNLAISFVGFFGMMNLALPAWVYRLFAGLAVLAVAGLIRTAFRRRLNWPITAILLVTILLSLAVTVYINLNFSQPQGRYLFPALAAIALLAGLGLEGLPRWGKWAAYCLLTALFAINIYALAFVVIPAYWS